MSTQSRDLMVDHLAAVVFEQYKGIWEAHFQSVVKAQITAEIEETMTKKCDMITGTIGALEGRIDEMAKELEEQIQERELQKQGFVESFKWLMEEIVQLQLKLTILEERLEKIEGIQPTPAPSGTPPATATLPSFSERSEPGNDVTEPVGGVATGEGVNHSLTGEVKLEVVEITPNVNEEGPLNSDPLSQHVPASQTSTSIEPVMTSPPTSGSTSSSSSSSQQTVVEVPIKTPSTPPISSPRGKGTIPTRKRHGVQLGGQILDKDGNLRFYCRCGNGYRSKAALSLHIQTKSARKISWKCNLCPGSSKTYSSLNTLKYHMRTQHKQPNYLKGKWVCLKCVPTVKVFNSRRDLLKHQLIDHKTPAKGGKVAPPASHPRTAHVHGTTSVGISTRSRTKLVAKMEFTCRCDKSFNLKDLPKIQEHTRCCPRVVLSRVRREDEEGEEPIGETPLESPLPRDPEGHGVDPLEPMSCRCGIQCRDPSALAEHIRYFVGVTP